MNNNLSLPKKFILKQTYENYRGEFEEILHKVEKKLHDVINLVSLPTYKSRIKSFNSYYKKVLRQKSQQAETCEGLVTLTDMIGIRVICAFLEDLGAVEKQIVSAFDIIEIERKGAEQSFREFGYESVHILIKIPDDCMPENPLLPIPDDMVCEIQVRTILQDAWAEVEHELIYKSEFNPFDKPLRRKLASINASLTLADMVFQEIRDYQNKLQLELGTRRNTFYEKADLITDEELGIDSKTSSTTPSLDNDMSQLNHASIDDLVLRALHEHNSGNYNFAIEIYSKILTSNPEPNNVVKGVIFKHRGMAYFAQSKYDQALEDFIKSEELDPKGFRNIYYEGIVYSVKNDYRKAIECFNRSLNIDKFQSHVYYRRALAYYELGEFSLAMQDINGAINLGLNDKDAMLLKEKLLKKFDMNM